MKTRIILAAMLLMTATSMMADDYKYLTISTGETADSISLPTVQRIAFEDGYAVVTTSEGKFSYPLSILDRITFTTSDIETAIEAMPEQAENLTYKDGMLAIKGDGMLRVYNQGGALVSIAYVKEGANVSLRALPAGIYIVRMGDKTIKVRK